MPMRRFLTAASAVILLVLAATANSMPIRLRTETITPPDKSQARFGVSAQTIGAKPAHYVLQFKGPVTDAWKKSVEDIGCQLEGYVPEYSFVAKMTPDQAAQVLKLDCVTWVQRLAAKHRLDARLSSGTKARCDIVIRLFPGESPAAVVRAIKEDGGSIYAETNGSNGYLRALVPRRLLSTISAIEGVEWVEEWSQPKVSNNVAQGIVGIPDFRTRSGLYGSGQIVAISDIGLDNGDPATLSADFAGRLFKAYALRRTNDWSDPTGHGTHVMGTLTGSGALSGSNPATHTYLNSYCGIAPEASYIIQSIGDRDARLYPPVNLSDLFSPTYSDGARIHSNSWGSTPTTPGQYTLLSQQVDDFCWSHKDFTVLFAAGNSGKDANSDGVSDLQTLDSPATAKNCISVGASESLRTTMGRIITYNGAWGTDFPATPISTDYISNNSSGMAGFSGRGPCQDGRIKPDICAPGTNIASCMSQMLTGAPAGWTALDSHYMFGNGTSMATPMVAGAAALVREYYMDNRGVTPSSALTKATLLNGAKDIYPGQYGTGSRQEIPTLRPNSVEGWGLLDFSSNPVPVLPRVLSFVDQSTGLSTGQSATYTYNVVGGSQPLNITLVWTDPPASLVSGSQLVNNLDLLVTGPTGTQYRGNGTVDTVNNVESVDLSSPAVGAYTVQIAGTNIPSGPQPFALVVTGMLPAGYATGVVHTASGAPVAGATVTAVGSTDTRSSTTSANGSYVISLAPGAYTVSASKTGWTFSSPVAITMASDPITGVDFLGSAPSGTITGHINQALGGRVGYVIETAHPYPDASPLTYTLTGPVGATHIRVHFEEISTLNQAPLHVDYLYVKTPGGTTIDTYTGSYSDVWSDWVPGNSLQVVLVPDASYIGQGFYGFYISGYETDVVSDGPLAGVTVAVQPGGATAVTGTDGTFTVTGLEPVSYTLTPSMPHWKFGPDFLTVNVPPSGTVSGANFQAYPPGSVSGTVSSSLLTSQTILVQSSHPYPNNSDLSYPISAPAGAGQVRVHFSSISVENGFDYVYVLDGSGNVVDYNFTGDFTDTWSSWIPGNTLTVELLSDDSVNGFGFLCDKIEYMSAAQPAAGIPVTLQGGATVTSGTDGAFSIGSVDEGGYVVSVAKPYWSFTPSSYNVNVVRGLNTGGLSFSGLLSVMPSAGYVKSLTDHEQVMLSSKVVSGGSDMFVDHFYIEEDDRSSGIRINSSTAVTPGKVVSVTGLMGTAPNGERQITPGTLTVATSTRTVPGALGLTNKALSGGSTGFDPVTGAGQRGAEGAVDLNNVGLLVRVCGVVTKSDLDYCYVDDGSGVLDDSTYKGVRVDCGNVLAPAVGKYVEVTGISSLILSGGHYYRTICPRDVMDLKIYK